VLQMTSFRRCYLSCKKIVMDEMTLIFMNIYRIEVNHFKYEIIWQNMQEKISDICLRFGSEYPSLGKPRYRPMGGYPRDGIE
jgi:hypothetical protein